jgi:plasmid stabilization system protein ParE
MPSSRSLDFSEEAEDDLRSILAYSLAEWGEAQRDAYAAGLDAAFQRLLAFQRWASLGPSISPDVAASRRGSM